VGGVVNVALYDVDATALPNFALAKLARFHLERGDRVSAYDPRLPLMHSAYDKIYASKIFDFSDGAHLDSARMEIGGSGWDGTLGPLAKKLPAEVDSLAPHYGLYPWFKHNMGYAMRGCRYRCDFCSVPAREGHARAYAGIRDLIVQDSDFLILLDNDFFGNPQWKERIAEIRSLDLKVCFSQGINIRIITEEQCQALASVRFTNLRDTRRQLYFAWDRFRDGRLILRGIDRVKSAGIKPWQMSFYVLIGHDSTPEEDMVRVRTLHEQGVDIYLMAKDRRDDYQKSFQRWVNGHISNHRRPNSFVPFNEYHRGVVMGSKR
jgi:hypothetical protein